MDSSYQYGLEFYGLSPTLLMTPATERAFLSMSIALQETQVSKTIRLHFEYIFFCIFFKGIKNQTSITLAVLRRSV